MYKLRPSSCPGFVVLSEWIYVHKSYQVHDVSPGLGDQCTLHNYCYCLRLLILRFSQMSYQPVVQQGYMQPHLHEMPMQGQPPPHMFNRPHPQPDMKWHQAPPHYIPQVQVRVCGVNYL